MIHPRRWDRQTRISDLARWVKAAKNMMFIHSWNSSTAALYFYQDDLGALESQRGNLAMVK